MDSLRGHRPGIAGVTFLDLRLGAGRPVGRARAMHVVEQARVAHQVQARRELLLAPAVFEAEHIVLVVGVSLEIRVRLFAAGRLRGIGMDRAVLPP